MRNLIIIFINLISISLFSQRLKYFDLITPELGGDHEAGNLVRVESDSSMIFVMGHVPKFISNSSNSGHPLFATVNYNGMILDSKILVDSLINETPFGNERMIKKNDSVYIALFYVKNSFNPDLAGYELFELNLRQNKILKRTRFYDFQIHEDVGIFTDTEVKDSVFHLVLQEYDKLIPNRYIYEIDLECKVRKVVLIKYNQPYLAYRWVSKSKNNSYDLIVNQTLFKGSKPTGKSFLTYLNVDSTGNVLKKKQLPDTTNINIRGGESFTVLRLDDRGFIFGCSESLFNDTIDQSKPLIIKTSPEFDTIIWKTSFYPFVDWVKNPEFFTNSFIAMRDNSGYILAGSWDTPPFDQPDYGLLFKVSLNGDSLWTRKYQPVGWDSLRGSFFTFKQITCTPYNTIVIAGVAGDRQSRYQKSWFLHVDSCGCIIPGCGEFVKVEDIISGREEAFISYPNPITDKLFIMSRITDDQLIIELINNKGDIILHNAFKAEEGVQYLLNIPDYILPSIYYLRIRDKSQRVWINKKIIKQ